MKENNHHHQFRSISTAIVCDWLTNLGGAEKVIKSLTELFPKAPIYTTLFDKTRVKGFEKTSIYTSFLQKIPFAQKKHPLFLGSMPMAIESFNLNNYELVISSSHSVAKGVITKPDTLHICYCHTPMRYAWEPWELEYRLSRFPRILHSSIKRKIHKLRIWDRLCADRVDYFIANSHYVAERIKKYYRRKSTVINPPVNTESFSVSEKTIRPDDKNGYYLMVGRLIPYKRFDLVIETCNKMKKELVIIGDGPEKRKLRKQAGPTIRFLGHVDDAKLKKNYRECKALIFPQLEDFGITPVECMASGRPVIAYGAGGALDYIVPGETGVFFEAQTRENLIKAILDFETQSWNTQKIKDHADKFSETRFHEEMLEFIRTVWKKQSEGGPSNDTIFPQ